MRITPWYLVGRSYQCSMRAPYCDLEVLPVDLGWQWRVCKIDPVTGRFAVVHQGTEDRLPAAKAAAVDAANRSR